MTDIVLLEESTGVLRNFGVEDKSLRDFKILVLFGGALWSLTFFAKEGSR